MTARLAAAFLLMVPLTAHADGPRDNLPDNVRQIPPKGIAVPDADRSELRAGVDGLGGQIESLRTALKGKPNLLKLLPDVQVYHKAVHDALEYGEFFKPGEIRTAKDLLRHGMERARQLREGHAPWDSATGLVVRGYVSKIDGSVQPYGLVVPKSYDPDSPHRYRLDVWCHGRGETLSEVNFLAQREKSPGEFTPRDAIVVHPYGRYCNANKFAGEIDLFEAIDSIKSHYQINDDQIVMRGFSMGGAACWQFAVHYPDRWVAAAPGAGFSETADFLKVFQKEAVKPTWYEQKLWHLYDCTDYALNLANLPTVAYSGENDHQKQAADMMAKALKAEGIELTHIIGKKAKHHYTPEAKTEINRRIDAIAEQERDPLPMSVRFTTWTLRYNRSYWVQIDGLDRHWERAKVEATLRADENRLISISTRNISALTLHFRAGLLPTDVLPKLGGQSVTIDGTAVDAPGPRSDRSWTAHFRKADGRWTAVPSDDNGTLRKRHGLQGPIDDAFMDSFLMVRPTGSAMNEKVAKWVDGELKHAADHWRKQFRGVARIEDDRDIDDAEIAGNNLVLWGDPSSNAVLGRIADRLPIRWSKEGVRLGETTYDAGHHVPVLIYPNPLNPKRYVVINSGFTFREYDYLSNARQVPRLPDYAVVDIDQPVTSRGPGKIVATGFFGERWELKKDGRP